MEKIDILIIGAGISGLSTGAFLKKKGLDFVMLEKGSVPGGVMRSELSGNYIFDMGSNSAVLKNDAIPELIQWAGMEDDMYTADRASAKRLIMKGGKLHAISGPLSMIFTPLFSWKAKWFAMGEFKHKPRIAEGDESMADFITRRLGKEILDYAVNPIIAGIYAGNPEEVSMMANYPRMLEAERRFGSVMKGMMALAKERRKNGEPPKKHPKSAIFSFKKGMQQLAYRLADLLKEHIQYDAEVQSVQKSELGGYLVTYMQAGVSKQLHARIVVSAAQAYTAAKYVAEMDANLSQKLAEIVYPAVLVLNLVYRKSAIAQNLSGFGYLIPAAEKQSYLGAIWSSSIFPNRAPEDEALFTIFVGGRRNPEMCAMPLEEAISKVRSEFEMAMRISEPPVEIKSKYWERAIPQYNMEYPPIAASIDAFEKSNPDFIVSGNYRKGFATGDCIGNARENAARIANILDKNN